MKSLFKFMLDYPLRILGLFDFISFVVIKLVSFSIIPNLIEKAYSGHGPHRLNVFFASRAVKKPIGYYLDLWCEFEQSIVLAILFHICILFLMRSVSFPRHLQCIVGFICGLFLMMTIVWGPRQDYVAHLEIWRRVWSGSDPWWTQTESGFVLNAYGPLFNLLAIPAVLNPLLPKLLFSLSYLIFVVMTVTSIRYHPILQKIQPGIIIFWFFNPAIWLELAFYGHFDIMMGILCLLAVLNAISGRLKWSGFFLGCGFLLKFLPVVLIPFLLIDGKKIIKWRWLLAASAIITIATGLFAAFLVWGDATFRPLLLAAGRGSNLLSIWRFLRGEHSPVLWFADSSVNLDQFALPCMVLALFGVLYLTLHQNRQSDLIAFLTLLTVLTFYRVGFVQYQMVLFVLLPCCIANHFDLIKQRPLLVISALCYFTWIGCFDLFDNFVGGIVGVERKYGWLEEWVGLPSFLFSLFFGVMLTITIFRTIEMQQSELIFNE